MSDDPRSSLFRSESVAENYARYLFPTVFLPWAARLVSAVAPLTGLTVLDVASGTGAVARAAAAEAGADGRVIASDISEEMLAAVAVGADPLGAPIETLAAPATALPLPDSSVDVVLCQHGLPFVKDQEAALREMSRVLKPGGRLGIVVWAADTRLEPFDSYGDVLHELDIPEPFPRAWDYNSFKMTGERLESLLAGFDEVVVDRTSLTQDWPSVEAAVSGMLGTPYGGVLSALSPADRERTVGRLSERMSATPRPTVTAYLATAIASVRG